MHRMIAKTVGIVAVLAGSGWLTPSAYAQAPAAAARPYEVGYVEAVAQSAFGNVTSQSFGIEGGYNLAPRIRVFAEIGLTRDTAPKSLGASAQLIAGYLTQIQASAVSFEVAQPVRFASVGVKYMIPYSDTIEPYVLGGFGLASVKRDVTFKVGGTDVTDNLAQYYVRLGEDLTGSARKGMLTLGGGVMWSVTKNAFIDFQYRFGRVMDDAAFNLNRAGGGVGFRF